MTSKWLLTKFYENLSKAKTELKKGILTKKKARKIFQQKNKVNLFTTKVFKSSIKINIKLTHESTDFLFDILIKWMNYIT